MIEIRHRATGEVVHRLEADTLVRADLTGINLCHADLEGMDLGGTVLAGSVCRFTRWRGADLSHADLRGAYLAHSEFQGANLSGALLFSVSLNTADLTGANPTGAYRAEAKLVEANLSYANLQSTYLADADLTGARLAFTLFADCPSLAQAAGLSEIEHLGPSTLDPSTMRADLAELPDAFLRGAGLTWDEPRTLRKLYAGAGRYNSCFLAFDVADTDLASSLQAGLHARSVNCWPFSADLGAGYALQIVFNHAVRRRSRLILLCSETAVRQGRVLEADRPPPILLILDDFLSGDLPPDAPLSDWTRLLRHCPTLDFRQWREGTRFRAALQKLLNPLASSSI